MYCPKCGEHHDEHARFCKNDGTPLVKEGEEAAETQEQLPVIEEQQTAPSQGESRQLSLNTVKNFITVEDAKAGLPYVAGTIALVFVWVALIHQGFLRGFEYDMYDMAGFEALAIIPEFFGWFNIADTFLYMFGVTPDLIFTSEWFDESYTLGLNFSVAAFFFLAVLPVVVSGWISQTKANWNQENRLKQSIIFGIGFGIVFFFVALLRSNAGEAEIFMELMSFTKSYSLGSAFFTGLVVGTVAYGAGVLIGSKQWQDRSELRRSNVYVNGVLQGVLSALASLLVLSVLFILFFRSTEGTIHAAFLDGWPTFAALVFMVQFAVYYFGAAHFTPIHVQQEFASTEQLAIFSVEMETFMGLGNVFSLMSVAVIVGVLVWFGRKLSGTLNNEAERWKLLGAHAVTYGVVVSTIVSYFAFNLRGDAMSQLTIGNDVVTAFFMATIIAFLATWLGAKLKS
ncbi:zinc ribbon domain-containing protein [Alteribacter aurantiacus]|uniref:zinc ribbon domain-containing protein n=1 Tax=Alteribacter aurantiacus TaxID=254410 RepID=UPI0003F8A7E9|nr:zinc ribbon domain-containing protein [Alteribacter aurantiacus]